MISRCLIPQEKYILKETWEVPDFEKVGSDTASPCFKVSGHNWRIVVMPKGTGAGRGNSVSVFLMHPACKTLHPVSFALKTVDGEKTAKLEKEWVFSPIVNNKGSEKFIPLNDLKSYLTKDGKLVFDLEINFNPPQTTGVAPSRKELGVVGLSNQGATCYLNSMLQNLFHTPCFRRAVYRMPTDGTEDPKKSIPYALQRLFTLMQMSPLTPSTTELTNSFGWGPYEAFQQHDVQEFLRVIIDNLETKMKKTPEKDIFANIFKGNTVNTIEVKEADYRSERKEDFYDVELVVKGNRNIYDAFQQYITEEKIDDYQVEDKKEKYTASHWTKFGDLPNILHIHLQRFEYSPGGFMSQKKINDRFEFPEELDLNDYVVDEKKSQETKYKLFGILIHIGNASFGHYEALMLVNGSWLLFNDDHVSKFTNANLLESTYGGENTWASAYFLSYIKESEFNSLSEVSDDELPEHLKNFYNQWVEQNTWKPESVKVDVFTDKSLRLQTSSVQESKSDTPQLNIPVNEYRISDCLKSFAQAANIKEVNKVQLYTIDKYGFPWTRINPNVLAADQFSKTHKALVTTQGFGETGTQPFTIAFFDPSKEEAVSILFITNLNQTDKPEKLMKRVQDATGVNEQLIAYYVSGISCSECNLTQQVGNKTGLIVFQSRNPKLDMSKFKISPDQHIFKSVDLLPELRSLSVEKYLQSLQNLKTITVYSIDKSNILQIQISKNSHIILLSRCIQAALKIPKSNGVLLFRQDSDNEPCEEPINMKSDGNINQLISGDVVYYYILPNVSQKDLDEKFFFQPDIEIDGKVTSPALLMPKNFTTKSVFEKLEKENLLTNSKDYRLIMLVGSRIVKTLDLDTKLETFLSNKFRIEKIPDDQKTPGKIARVTFSTSTRDPRNSTTGTPFYLKLIDGEAFKDTKERIIKASSVDPTKISFGFSNGTSAKFNIIKDDDITTEKLENNYMIYVFVPCNGPSKHRRPNPERAFVIYN